jgi:acetylornithine deacetylase/succinyl-diaminopimelate desuccinylase-like protein
MMPLTPEMIDYVIENAIKIQNIPSPTFSECLRAKFVKDEFTSLGLRNIEVDSVGNVYGKISGGNGSPLILSAHLDSVLIPISNQLLKKENNKLSGPGIGDNSLGLAALISLGMLLSKHSFQLPEDIWLVADVGEEGLGNLLGCHQVVERFGRQVSAYVALEGIGLGHVQNAALGIRRIKVEVSTKGGHSWNNYGDPSAIHELVKISTRVVALKLPENPRCSINIGVIQGGDTINTIASHAEMQIDIRSEAPETLDSLVGIIHKVILKETPAGAQISITEIGSRPSGKIAEDHALIRLAREALLDQGITPLFTSTSSDASLPISLGLPATCLGITTGDSIHTLQETIDLAPINKGIGQILYLIEHSRDL